MSEDPEKSSDKEQDSLTLTTEQQSFYYFVIFCACVFFPVSMHCLLQLTQNLYRVIFCLSTKFAVLSNSPAHQREL